MKIPATLLMLLSILALLTPSILSAPILDTTSLNTTSLDTTSPNITDTADISPTSSRSSTSLSLDSADPPPPWSLSFFECKENDPRPECPHTKPQWMINLLQCVKKNPLVFCLKQMFHLSRADVGEFIDFVNANITTTANSNASGIISREVIAGDVDVADEEELHKRDIGTEDTQKHADIPPWFLIFRECKDFDPRPECPRPRPLWMIKLRICMNKNSLAFCLKKMFNTSRADVGEFIDFVNANSNTTDITPDANATAGGSDAASGIVLRDVIERHVTGDVAEEYEEFWKEHDEGNSTSEAASPAAVALSK